MKSDEQVKRLRRIIARGRRFGATVAKRWAGAEADASAQKIVDPLLSVVVPMYGVEKYLPDSLRSLADQTYQNLEIVLVDDCSPDRSLSIAREFASADSRFKVLALEKNVGLSDARNAGVECATGEYLAFLDSDDYIKPDAYAQAITSLLNSGSDFALMGYWRFNSTRKWGSAPWIQALHVSPRPACSPSEFPDMQMNAVAWSKVYRREFWNRAALRFPSGRKYEDQPVSARAYSIAQKVDVLEGSFIGWRDRDDGSSISQQIHTVADLKARLDAARDSIEISAELGMTELAHHRKAQLLANDFPHSVMAVPRSDQQFFDVLHVELRDLLANSDDSLWDRMSPQFRVAYELLIRNDRERLIDFYEAGGGNLKNFRTFVDGDHVYAELPFFSDRSLGIPRERFRLIARQTELQTSVTSVQRDLESQRIVIEGWAYFDNVDSIENPYDLAVYVRNRRTAETISLETVLIGLDVVSETTKHKWCNYENATFRATLDLADWPALSRSEEWEVLVRAEAGPLRATTELRGLRRTGSAGHLGAVDFADGGRLLGRRTARGGLEFVHYRPFCSVTDARIIGRSVRLELSASKNAAFIVAHNRGQDLEVRAEVLRDENGAYAVLELPSLRLPASGLTGGSKSNWVLRAERFTGKKRSPLAWRMSDDVYGAELQTGATVADNVQLIEARTKFVVTSAESVQSDLTLKLDSAGADFEKLTVSLVGRRLSTHTDISPTSGAFEATLDLESSSFGLPKLPFPPGRYSLMVDTAGPEPILLPSLDLLNKLPLELSTQNMRARLDRDRSGKLCIDVKLPLKSNERGSRHQRELQDWHASLPPQVVPRTYLFRSYYGENSACNPGAIAKYLASENNEESVYIAVRDHSVAVPAGCISVIHESKEWYALLRSAEVFMDNMHQPIYHAKSAGQKVVESFHGYPFKEMGHAHWDKLGFTRQRVQSFDRRAAEWDYLVSPAKYATPLLRRDFRFEGEVLEIGYPRNDILLGAEAAAIRLDTRERLGIKASQQVVLYAPTFRDYLSKNDSSAPMIDFLDLDRLTGALGSDTQLLIRGHAFNARSGSVLDLDDYPNMVDVTDYADVADLYLAADVLIADFSSLRFDFAITGKPMIFFVPDLELYRAERAWVVPFEETAPGPKVSTTEEVIDALKDIDGVRNDYREAYQEFTDNYLDLDDGFATQRLVNGIKRADDPANHCRPVTDVQETSVSQRTGE